MFSGLKIKRGCGRLDKLDEGTLEAKTTTWYDYQEWGTTDLITGRSALFAYILSLESNSTRELPPTYGQYEVYTMNNSNKLTKIYKLLTF